MASIAAAAILQHASAGNDVSYTAIGADLLPGASQQEQRAAGKGAVVLMLRELAVFYGRRRPRRTRILFEDELAPAAPSPRRDPEA
jgi:hypothetical protein